VELALRNGRPGGCSDAGSVHRRGRGIQREARWGQPVTETDVAVERALSTSSHGQRPDDGFPGRGDRAVERRAEAVDCGIRSTGHAALSRGGQAWGTLIALSDHGSLVVGVATAPATGGRWWAGADSGAWVQHAGHALRELCVTSAADLGTARWVCHPSIESLGPARRERLRPLIEQCGRPLTPTTHGALMVADGEAEFCVQLSGGPWDFAALAVIVETAAARSHTSTGRSTCSRRGWRYSRTALLTPVRSGAIRP